MGRAGWREGWRASSVEDPLEEDRVTGQKPEGCGLKGVFIFDF